MTRRLLLALLALSWPAADAAGQALPVPFVPQGELLCGGATVAMVMRFHGVRGVGARDFAHLVRPEEGGIRTGDLADAVADRGWAVDAGAGDMAGLARALDAKRPPIVLLADGGDRYHYVTVVGLGDDAVVVHDPWVGPERPVPRTDFEARWSDAGRWAMVVSPPPAAPAATPAAREGAADPVLVRASERFRAEDWAEAARLAEASATEGDGGSRAWRLAAVSRWLAGDPDGALATWEHAGGPVLDLVRVRGVRRTRHPVIHDLAGLEPGSRLDRDALARAHRRIGLLPAASASRVSWRPVSDSLVEVEIAVVERPLVPTGRIDLLAAAIRAAARSETSVTVASPWGTGSGLTVGGRWARASRRAALSLAAPGVAGLPGVVTLEMEWRRERYADGGREGLTRAALRHEDWVSGRIGWWLEASADDWDHAGGGASASAGVRWHPLSGLSKVEARAGGGAVPGSSGYGVGAVAAGLRSSARKEGWTVSAEAGLVGVTPGTPRPLWPGAGVGDLRDGLLRAHPLDEGGAIAGPAFGRTLASAGVDVVRWMEGPPPLRLGVAAFADVAGAGHRPTWGTGPERPGVHVDAGLGLRLALPGASGHLALDGAVGLRDGATVLSVSWRSGWR